MSIPILATKLYIPHPRTKVVIRPRLIERLNENLCQAQDFGYKLTLISAPAGFGKTTLVSEWSTGCRQPVAWLSLDTLDNDPAHFLAYFVAALQTISSQIGEQVLGVIQSSQPPPVASILITLLNDIAGVQENFVLILDDYHVIDSRPIDQILDFFIERLPPQMHLVIVTREDPRLPLARLRSKNQLIELRAADLRFTLVEAADFLNRAMGLKLSPGDIAALDTRTEGWIAGLQMAAISMQRHQDAAGFIKSFTGSHHFVMDYLVEEVLQQQPKHIQTFLLTTSILDRMCGSLCDAVLLDGSDSGQETLEYLERTNLFITPLDSERRWYRYHHLFSDLLRQRLYQSIRLSTGESTKGVAEYHIRASQWYEDNRLDIEAFQHAAAAQDVERAERLIDGRGIPLHFRGAVTPILSWLESLSPAIMNARPSLWWRHAALLLINGQTIGVEEKLLAAEAALGPTAMQGVDVDEKTRNLIGLIATARATLALTRYQVETMLEQSRRALAFLHPKTLFSRSTACWTQGYAYFLLQDRTAARQSFTDAITFSRASGAVFSAILATIGLGNVQEADNQLYEAADTYRQVLQLAGEHPQQIVHEAHLGLARIYYEWNDLQTADWHARQSLQLAQQYEVVIDRFIICQVFLARLLLAHGDVSGAASILAEAEQSVRRQNFVHRMPEVATAQVLVLLREGRLAAATSLAQSYNLPLSLARVHLARGDTVAALGVLEAYDHFAQEKRLEDERLKGLVLQAIAFQAHSDLTGAVQALTGALALAEPGGFVRVFLDEGEPLAQLLFKATSYTTMPAYAEKLMAVFAAEHQWKTEGASPPADGALIEPLSPRELEILQLVAEGLSNQEISARLFLALSTVKGHNRVIFDKLNVQRRTEAVARARALGLL